MGKFVDVGGIQPSGRPFVSWTTYCLVLNAPPPVAPFSSPLSTIFKGQFSTSGTSYFWFLFASCHLTSATGIISGICESCPQHVWIPVVLTYVHRFSTSQSLNRRVVLSPSSCCVSGTQVLCGVFAMEEPDQIGMSSSMLESDQMECLLRW